ncbi:DUF2262 domain-containing protein [Verrucomicrobiaceae bacterium 5K15]|uniref:DUF2262 domain-containing protein n=1 Tax=Oceaniferula flava TaxID=2800421 RepID=A0AAE2SHC5_9BACT|nr:DUF2262 domain-containing protein [Oceaniferula flavus]MBK1856585.1 DUF2262 domain-containing protein [Oceaniferula flavus]MBM1137893.1 DUF2262 domain-containing protein [Oceaniferula flavus]
MKDAVLGTLKEDKHIAHMLIGTILHKYRKVKLTISLEGEALENCLEWAREAVGDLKRIDDLAKQAACEHLLPLYNENWREYEQSDGRGAWEIISNPILTLDEIRSEFRLSTFQVEGVDSLCLWYSDGDLFGGHDVVVSSSERMNFDDLTVNLWG